MRINTIGKKIHQALKIDVLGVEDAVAVMEMMHGAPGPLTQAAGRG